MQSRGVARPNEEGRTRQRRRERTIGGFLLAETRRMAIFLITMLIVVITDRASIMIMRFGRKKHIGRASSDVSLPVELISNFERALIVRQEIFRFLLYQTVLLSRLTTVTRVVSTIEDWPRLRHRSDRFN